MTAESSTTPADPRAVSNTIAMRSAGAFRQSVEPELRVSKLYALNLATKVVTALSDAGFLSLPEREAETEDAGVASFRARGTPVKAPRLRRSGSPWTIRAHTWTDGQQTPSHTISNREVPADSEHHRGHLFPGAEFDELVVGRWLHVEQMDNRTWWMNAGGVTLHVTADRDGRPTRVRVDGPGDYDEPREDCEYSLTWTRPTASGTPTGTGEET